VGITSKIDLAKTAVISVARPRLVARTKCFIRDSGTLVHNISDAGEAIRFFVIWGCVTGITNIFRY
jgi:hypothetical protein